MVAESCLNHPTCDLKLWMIPFSCLNIIFMLSGCWWKYYDSESYFRPQPCVYGSWLQAHGDVQRYSTLFFHVLFYFFCSRIKGCNSSWSDIEYRVQRKHSFSKNMLFHSFYMQSGWTLNVMVVITVADNSNSIAN